MFEIFILSFLVALTGALSPGPLLTFTIYKSLKQKRGYLAGIYIILGHATIELILIIVLLLFQTAILLFQNILFLAIIGIIGGILLVMYGFMVIRNVFKTKIAIEFENSQHMGFKGNSFLGGIIVSLSNPYWEFWWAVIGLGFLISYNVSFANPLGLLLFFLGHELGDAVWYLPISTIAYFGGKSLNPKIFKYILFACGVFMVIFGLYLAINIIISPPQF
ncbi:MAG: LysE family transporter [Candidatus Lokiarchaeota archaeon]|nr:LysE family transporter [Candidatus Lokiarchaeota archaeon]